VVRAPIPVPKTAWRSSRLSAALTGPGAAENAGQHTAEVPFRRDGWLGPIELNERTEPLTTAMATPKAVAVATKRVGSGRSRRASDRGLLPTTLESYLTLLGWTGRQLLAGTHGAAGFAAIVGSRSTDFIQPP
jgi:hypothetical protein